MSSRPICIIGGGPAGSAAAIHMARAGHAVTLLERKRQAHDKVCGEFISWEAARDLASLGLDLHGLGAEPINHLGLCHRHKHVAQSLPFTAWSLSRRRLDDALLQLAASAGADIRRGTTVKTLNPGDAGWNVTVSLTGGESQHLHAKNVFLASGKHDLRGWQRPKPSQEMVGMKMHFELTLEQQKRLQETVEVHLFSGGYAGLEPIEEGKANLCFLIRKQLYSRWGQDWESVLQALFRESPHLEERLSEAQALWQRPLAVSGVPYGYITDPKDAIPGLYRLGDQTAVIPSFAGDGIAIALRSAKLATETLIAGGNSRDYHRAASRTFQRPVNNAQHLASLLNHSWARNAALVVAQQWPWLLHRTITALRLHG